MKNSPRDGDDASFDIKYNVIQDEKEHNALQHEQQRQTKIIQVFDHSAIYSSSNNTASNFYMKEPDTHVEYMIPKIVINQGCCCCSAQNEENEMNDNDTNYVEMKLNPLQLNVNNLSYGPHNGLFSQYDKRLETIRETNSDFDESKRIIDTHLGTKNTFEFI